MIMVRIGTYMRYNFCFTYYFTMIKTFYENQRHYKCKVCASEIFSLFSFMHITSLARRSYNFVLDRISHNLFISRRIYPPQFTLNSKWKTRSYTRSSFLFSVTLITKKKNIECIIKGPNCLVIASDIHDLTTEC